jgi:hypothetical protein
LLERLRNVKAKRLLCIFNACHAGEVSPTLGADEEPSTGAPLPEKTAAALLATGSGRVIITACREDQVSFVGSGALTLFTQALVDGLQGKGDYISNRGGFISIFDLYSHLYDKLQEWVPAKISAYLRQKYGERQEPELTVIKGVGPFAVSLYRGATMLGSFSAPEQPDIDAGLREIDPKRSERLLNQLLQIQAGRDTNTAGRDLSTAGRDNLSGAHIEGGYTGGNRTEQQGGIHFGSGGRFGDLTFGDIAGRDIIKGNTMGDNIKVGDISNSDGIAIGCGAQANVTKGVQADQLAAAFSAVYQQLAASPESPAIKGVVEEQVKAVEAEAAKGEAADAGKIQGWLTVIARMMPDILEVTANTLLSPVSGVATVVKKVAEKAKQA